jgi:hypothetical protein
VVEIGKGLFPGLLTLLSPLMDREDSIPSSSRSFSRFKGLSEATGSHVSLYEELPVRIKAYELDRQLEAT